jgi:flagellar basal body-associated protein FliL
MSDDTAELLASIVILWAAAIVAYLSIFAQQEAATAETSAEEAEDPPEQGSNFSPLRHGCRGGSFVTYEKGWWE